MEGRGKKIRVVLNNDSGYKRSTEWTGSFLAAIFATPGRAGLAGLALIFLVSGRFFEKK
nr:hypothetical protein Josef01_10c16_05 [uncultured archaeon]